eukprot:COSAG04_NODE_30149_length_264_cov_0.933333_1_plen_21_part_10
MSNGRICLVPLLLAPGIAPSR